MEQGEDADVRTNVSATQDDPLTPGKRGLQMIAAADFDQLSQGTGPAPESHHIDDIAGAEPEQVADHALSLILAEPITQHLTQVTNHLGPLLRPCPESPCAPHASDTVGEAGRRQATSGAAASQ